MIFSILFTCIFITIGAVGIAFYAKSAIKNGKLDLNKLTLKPISIFMVVVSIIGIMIVPASFPLL